MRRTDGARSCLPHGILNSFTQCLMDSVVPVSEASVMIAVSSEHRREALDAVSYAIDQVKSTATIWKKVSKCDVRSGFSNSTGFSTCIHYCLRHSGDVRE